MSASFTVIYLFTAIVVSAFISLYAWRNPQTRSSRAFAAACLISTVWMFGDLVSRLSETLTGEWIGEAFRYLGVPLMPVALLIFIYRYCGRNISRRRIKWLLVIPFVSWLMMLTDSWHSLFFKSVQFGAQDAMRVEYGIYFRLVHLPFSYVLLLIGFYTVLMELSRASRHYRKQIALLLFSLCIPFIVNVLVVAGLLENLTPLSFPVFFVVMAYAIFRHQFLGSNPIAYETVFQTIRDGVLILDRHDVVRDVNPAVTKVLGKTSAQIVGLHVREAFKNWRSAVELYDAKPLELGELEVTLLGSPRYLSIDSTPLAVGSNEKSEGRIITIRDITDRHQHELSLEAMAFHDPLTRLANRRKFQEEATRGIERANELNEPLAILYFDLNRFKAVNDTLGHETGDELLKYVAARVASILRKPDLLARLGGDEFALLLHGCDAGGIELVVERLLENVQRPFAVGEHTLVASLSVGAAFYPQDGENLTELLRAADAAMYRAKQSGGGLAPPEIRLDSPANLEM